MLHLIDKLAGAWFDWRARRVSGNPELVSLNNVELNEDGLTVTGFSPAIAVLADGAAAMLEHHNAKNFVEFDMYPRLDRGMQPVRVAVAWANGEMPSAKCVRLEKECVRLEGAKRQLLPIAVHPAASHIKYQLGLASLLKLEKVTQAIAIGGILTALDLVGRVAIAVTTQHLHSHPFGKALHQEIIHFLPLGMIVFVPSVAKVTWRTFKLHIFVLESCYGTKKVKD